MQKNIIRFGLTGFVLAASLLLLSTERPVKSGVPVAPAIEKKPTCCKKASSCEKKETREESSLDNFSRQFI
jgi:hypothetical protein